MITSNHRARSSPHNSQSTRYPNRSEHCKIPGVGGSEKSAIAYGRKLLRSDGLITPSRMETRNVLRTSCAEVAPQNCQGYRATGDSITNHEPSTAYMNHQQLNLASIQECLSLLLLSKTSSKWLPTPPAVTSSLNTSPTAVKKESFPSRVLCSHLTADLAILAVG